MVTFEPYTGMSNTLNLLLAMFNSLLNLRKWEKNKGKLNNEISTNTDHFTTHPHIHTQHTPALQVSQGIAIWCVGDGTVNKIGAVDTVKESG